LVYVGSISPGNWLWIGLGWLWIGFGLASHRVWFGFGLQLRVPPRPTPTVRGPLHRPPPQQPSPPAQRLHIQGSPARTRPSYTRKSGVYWNFRSTPYS
jgi:hypothetical protein